MLNKSQWTQGMSASTRMTNTLSCWREHSKLLSTGRLRTALLSVVLVLVLVGLLLGATGSAAAKSADMVVAADGSGDYTVIQNAVDNATDGDKIKVESGTYSESIDVSKNVDIVAPNGATISPSSNAVSAVALTDGTESRLVNLSIEGTNSIGLDARSSTGDWTAKNIEITGFRFGVTALGSKGDWVINNSKIENSNRRGIAPETSEGNWTIKSSIIRNVSGIGIDASRIDAGLIKDTVVENITQPNRYDGWGIMIRDTSGDWIIDNVTVKNTKRDGINAGDTNATHDPVIRDTRVIDTADEGIDIADSKSGFLITGSTIQDTGPGKYKNAIRIEETEGDWTIQDTVIRNISGEGIDAYRQPEYSRATIQNLTIEDTQNVGVNLYQSDGDWTISDTIVQNSDSNGINADESNGELNINNLTVRDVDGDGIDADSAGGNITVRDTGVKTAYNGIDAEKSNGQLIVSNFTVRDTDGDGIDASNATGDATVQASAFTNMGDKSIDVIDSEGKWEIHESILTGGREGAVDAWDADRTVNATYNYWGAADGPSGQFNGSGGEASGNIVVTPYYTDSSLTTLSSATSPGTGSGPAVTFRQPQQTVTTNGTTTVDIVLTDAPNGVSTYSFTLTSGDSNTATFTDFSFGGSPSSSTKQLRYGSNNATLTATGGLAGISAGSNVTLGTVTIKGTTKGSTTLGVTVDSLLDRNNAQISAGVSNGTVSVTSGPSALPGQSQPPTDPDGDGVFEDLNGDGSADLRDLQPFFNLVRPSASPPSTPSAFDINGDGSADLRDLQPFFNEVRP